MKKNKFLKIGRNKGFVICDNLSIPQNKKKDLNQILKNKKNILYFLTFLFLMILLIIYL